MDGGLREQFRRHLPQVDWQSVETPLTGGGVPDANYCVDGREGWVEFKLARTNGVVVRPDQVAWALRRIRHGGRVTFAVRRKNVYLDELWLVPGMCAKLLHEVGLAHPWRDHWTGGPSAWDWGAVLNRLKM